MAIRFRKSIKILPGVKLNLSKTGISVSAGVRGARVTVGKRGTHATVGLPGTGLSVTKKIGGKSKAKASQEIKAEPITKLSKKEIKLRVQEIDGKKFIYSVLMSLFVGCLVWYFLNWYCGLGACIGLIFARINALNKEIAKRPVPDETAATLQNINFHFSNAGKMGAYPTKHAAQMAIINTLKAIKLKKQSKEE